jgi:1,4-alpha-glucan branching enzyme
MGRTAERMRRAKVERPGAVLLRVFAPSVEGMAVVGSWDPGAETPLERQDDNIWQALLPLADGRYTYRLHTRSRSWFQEGKQVKFVDPYAREIERREDGEWGVLTVRRGYPVVDGYRWRHEAERLPRDRELVIYELHVGDFSGGLGDESRFKAGTQGHSGEPGQPAQPGTAPSRKGRFADVIASLPYLKELGVNAVELMPLAAGPNGYSWGYTPRYFYAVNPRYGTPTELNNLVDACHAEGIRVLLDMVANHADVETPLTQIDHDYWFHHSPPEGQPSYGPKFNLEFRDASTGVMPARKFLNEMLMYWATEYHLDGIRFDATAPIDDFDFLGWIGSRLKEESDSKPFLLIGEHLPLNPALVSYSGPLDSAWHDTFYYNITATLRDAEYEGAQPFTDALLDVLEPGREGYEGPRSAIQYVENHDHDRPLFSLAQVGIQGEEALRRAALGALLLLTAVGIPMLYHGQEFGMAAAKTLDECKLDWRLLDQAPNRALHDRCRAMIELRTHTPALQSGEVEMLACEPERRLLALRRWATEHQGGGELIVVDDCGNVDAQGWEVPNWPAGGPWSEVGSDAAIAPREGEPVRVDVPRWSARLFLNEEFVPDM